VAWASRSFQNGGSQCGTFHFFLIGIASTSEAKTTVSNSTQCVVPENIHTPPTEGIGNSGGVGGLKGPGISGAGEGGCLNDFFFPRLVLIFIQLYVKFRRLHFTSRVANAKNKSCLFVYVIGLHAVQFGNNWMKQIPTTAKNWTRPQTSPIWLSEEFF